MYDIFFLNYKQYMVYKFEIHLFCTCYTMHLAHYTVQQLFFVYMTYYPYQQQSSLL